MLFYDECKSKCFDDKFETNTGRSFLNQRTSSKESEILKIIFKDLVLNILGSSSAFVLLACYSQQQIPISTVFQGDKTDKNSRLVAVSISGSSSFN